MEDTGQAQAERPVKVTDIMTGLMGTRDIVDAIRVNLGIVTAEPKSAEDRNPILINLAVAGSLERDIGEICQYIRYTTLLLKEVDVATKRLRMTIIVG